MLSRSLGRCFILGACWLMATVAGAMVPEDIYQLRQVGLGDVSADGQTFFYSLSTWDKEGGQWQTSMYRRDLQTGSDLLIFSPEDKSSQPVFSPDGSQVAYLKRNQDGDAGLWVMEPDGSNRRKLNQAIAPFGTPQWSPDGTRLAWIVSADVGAYEGLEGARVVADHLGYRHLNVGYRQGKLAQVFVMDVDDGLPRRLVDADLDCRSLDWSPDGTQLVVSAKRTADLGRTLNTDLFLVDVAGGPPVPLTDNPGLDEKPQWLPDGRIAWLEGEDPIWESCPRVVAVMDPAVGVKSAVRHGAEFDNLFMSFFHTDDTFFVVGAIRGCLDLVQVYEDEFSVVTTTDMDIWSVKARGDQAIVLAAGQMQPSAIFTVDLKSPADGPRAPEPLIDPNSQWRDRVHLTQPEPFEVEVDGQKIQGWYFHPTDQAPGHPVPTVLSIHGGPEWMYGGYFLPEFHILPSFGYGVVIANPVGSMGYGFEFMKGVRGDWVDRPARQVLACLDAAVAAGWADPDRLAVMGGSYGGHLAAELTTQSGRFRAAACDRMYPDLPSFWGTTDEKWFAEYEFMGRPWEPDARDVYERNSPFARVDHVTTPTLVSQGMYDYRCLIAGGEMWFSALQTLGVPSRFIRFENEGHGIRNPDNLVFYHNQLLNWFDQHVLGVDHSLEDSRTRE